MDVQITRTGGLFLYDARRDQYDTTIIQDLSGVPSIVGNKLLISSADIVTFTAGANVNVEMLISCPVAPVAAQDKVFGLKSPIGNRGAMVFVMDGANFYAKVYNAAGDTAVYEKLIPWSAAWTATETRFRIACTERLCEFYIEDTRVGMWQDSNLARNPMPIRITNANADNLLIGSLALY